MANSTLERLPLLIQESICEWLVSGEPKRHSLTAFAQASKKCHEASERARFECVTFEVRDRAQLEDAVRRVSKYTGSIRRLKIVGCITPKDERPDKERCSKVNLKDKRVGFGDSYPRAHFDACSSHEAKSIHTQFWQPLAHCLGHCGGLKDLVWSSTARIPSSILRVIHEKLPRLRLHVNTFSLRSLSRLDHDVDMDEYLLATSPCLSSIHAISIYDYTDKTYSALSYNEDAVMQLVAVLAPNIQTVGMWYQESGQWHGVDLDRNVYRMRRAMSNPRPTWAEIFGKKRDWPSKRTSSVKSLALMSLDRGDQWLRNWTAHIDFTHLRRLEIDNGHFFLDELCQVAEHGAFESLRELRLDVSRDFVTSGPNRKSLETNEIRLLATKLLTTLNPLRGLSVSIALDQKMIHTIPAHHGSSLRTLHLPNTQFNHHDIQGLRHTCPNISELQLVLQRNEESYKSLGSLPRLEQLSLILDCHDPTSTAPSSPSEARLRTRCLLIHGSLDSLLAEHIFRTILSSSRATHPNLLPPFQRLSVRNINRIVSGYIPRTILSRVLDYIGREWRCERVYADMSSDAARTRELGREGDKQPFDPDDEAQIIDMTLGGDGEGVEEVRQGVTRLRELWDELWPQARGKSGWINTWHSFLVPGEGRPRPESRIPVARTPPPPK
ncbi:hypothetical protein EJ04DRAFT_244422 [Polyplosphaeria fusca]|uniref:Uncharacterized protein n=1 Tax=Polyplosphaeria fusca TaxID=682080 RepID=A0A9P4QXD8_9PLEO|nr:hypothetical protein EJ04DRAFT_244422 [Polyplosphaeria fusca]